MIKTGAYLADHHGAAIARTLGRLGVPVYAAVESRATPIAVSRYVKGTFVWHGTGLAAETLLECLTTVSRALGRTAVLIPIDDVASILLAEHAVELRERFLFPHPTPDLPRRLADKR